MTKVSDEKQVEVNEAEIKNLEARISYLKGANSVLRDRQPTPSGDVYSVQYTVNPTTPKGESEDDNVRPRDGKRRGYRKTRAPKGFISRDKFASMVKCCSAVLTSYHEKGLLKATVSDTGRLMYTPEHVPLYKKAREKVLAARRKKQSVTMKAKWADKGTGNLFEQEKV